MSTLATRDELTSAINALKTQIQNSGGSVVDILNGNTPIKFESNNQIKQCPVDCVIMMNNMGANDASVNVSGDGVTWFPISIAYGGVGITLKRGTFVQSTKNYDYVYLYPCSKYDAFEWYYEYDGESKLWLPPSSGKYHIQITGGKSGNATMEWHNGFVSQGSTTGTGANGRSIAFTANITRDDANPIVINVGVNSANVSERSGALTEWAWCYSEAGGTSSFGGITAEGGTRAGAATIVGGQFQHIDGTVPTPGYSTSGAVSSISIVGDISSSSDISKSCVSIVKLTD